MHKEIMSKADKRMTATAEDFRQRLSTFRTGRASLGILDRVSVDYYGTPTPLSQAVGTARSSCGTSRTGR